MSPIFGARLADEGRTLTFLGLFTSAHSPLTPVKAETKIMLLLLLLSGVNHC